MRSFLSLLPMLVPALPLAAGLLARSLPTVTAGRLCTSAAWLAFSVALVATLFLAFGVGEPPISVALLGFDQLSAVMALLVAFLGACVLRFSQNYLAGDPKQARFLSWMSLTLASVLTLVLAQHLLLILAAWITTSLSLHQLLLHHPGRSGAIFSARKKFVVSRLGDAALLAAIVLLYQNYGTFDLPTLFSAVAAQPAADLPLVGFFLVACAALESAQFPFPSWLPVTMETPTPVSAFMHAGIINAGGFLILRLSPLFEHAPAALYTLAAIGAITAAFGAVVMLAQPSVKRALAYSTIAQMGFMLLQCGLGYYGLALLHIVAHSIYKAHAFLRAGSTIGAVPRAAVKLPVPLLSLGLLGGGLVVAGLTTLLHVLWPAAVPPIGLFTLILALAAAYGLARTWSAPGGRNRLKPITVTCALVLLALALHSAAKFLLPSASVAPPPVLLVALAGIFVALFVFQALLWRAAHVELGRRLYVHALNGFYVGTLANRLLSLLWPRHSVS